MPSARPELVAAGGLAVEHHLDVVELGDRNVVGQLQLLGAREVVGHLEAIGKAKAARAAEQVGVAHHLFDGVRLTCTDSSTPKVRWKRRALGDALELIARRRSRPCGRRRPVRARAAAARCWSTSATRKTNGAILGTLRSRSGALSRMRPTTNRRAGVPSPCTSARSGTASCTVSPCAAARMRAARRLVGLGLAARFGVLVAAPRGRRSPCAARRYSAQT